MSNNVYNTNTGPGNFNYVLGNQTNTNIIAFCRVPSFEEHEPVFVVQNDQYRVLLHDIAYIRTTFKTLKQLWPADASIVASWQRLDDFAWTFGFAARALEYITEIPGNAKSLQFFQKIRSIVDECQLRVAKIRRDITVYQNELQAVLLSTFWRRLFAVIFAKHSWAPMLNELHLLLSDNQTILRRFLCILTTSAWRSLVSVKHARELDQLIRQAGLPEESMVRDVDIQKVLLVDHLGRRLIVPIEFCASWLDFDFLIKQTCRNVIGCDLIQRNAWEIIHGRNDQVVSAANFAQLVQPGMLLEMSIVLWQQSSSAKACPRCKYDNSRNNEYDGWIECGKCLKRFQIRSTDKCKKRKRGLKAMCTEAIKHVYHAFKRPKLESNNSEPKITSADFVSVQQANRIEVQYFNRITINSVRDSLTSGTNAGVQSSKMDLDNTNPLATLTSNADDTPRLLSNAYLIFARRRRQLLAANKSMRPKEAVKTLRREWNNMGMVEKQVYLDLAKIKQDEFDSIYPNYIYRPRPKNSRKRRSECASQPADNAATSNHDGGSSTSSGYHGDLKII